MLISKSTKDEMLYCKRIEYKRYIRSHIFKAEKPFCRYFTTFLSSTSGNDLGLKRPGCESRSWGRWWLYRWCSVPCAAGRTRTTLPWWPGPAWRPALWPRSRICPPYILRRCIPARNLQQLQQTVNMVTTLPPNYIQHKSDDFKVNICGVFFLCNYY